MVKICKICNNKCGLIHSKSLNRKDQNDMRNHLCKIKTYNIIKIRPLIIIYFVLLHFNYFIRKIIPNWKNSSFCWKFQFTYLLTTPIFFFFFKEKFLIQFSFSSSKHNMCIWLFALCMQDKPSSNQKTHSLNRLNQNQLHIELHLCYKFLCSFKSKYIQNECSSWLFYIFSGMHIYLKNQKLEEEKEIDKNQEQSIYYN